MPKDTSEGWVTADGGQTAPEPKKGQSAEIVVRPWVFKKGATKKVHHFAVPVDDSEYPHLGGGAEDSKPQSA